MKRTVAFSPSATNVFLHLLTRCNLSCRHCYINPDQHGREILPIETVEAWLAAFAGQSREANVIFLGGEPTLHPDLPRAVRAARALGYASVTIDTNGYLFHDILDRVTPAEVDFFSFSLDGASPETNDRLRGKGCYETCVSGLRRARARGFATSLIYTVSRWNLTELPAMVPLVQDIGIDRFFIQVIGIRGKSAGTTEESLQLTWEEWNGTVPRVAEEIAAAGIPVTYPKVFLEPEDPFVCAGTAAKNYFLFPNGRVYRCPLCEDFPLHSLVMADGRPVPAARLNENDFFRLTIPEGCVMNKLIQPDNIAYDGEGRPRSRIACCMLKEEVS